MPLPDPFDRIHRLIGRRSFPDDWPRCYDSWDAYDEAGEFLLTLHYKGLAPLLDGNTFEHEVTLDFEDDLGVWERRFVVQPNMSFDLTLRITLFDGSAIENPDRLVAKAEIINVIRTMMTLQAGPTP